MGDGIQNIIANMFCNNMNLRLLCARINEDDSHGCNYIGSRTSREWKGAVISKWIAVSTKYDTIK